MSRWPQKGERAEYKKNGTRVMREGEANILRMRLFENDRSARGQEWHVCCGCGFRHLFSYEVFRTPEGNFYLGIRSYADERTRPKSRSRRKK